MLISLAGNWNYALDYNDLGVTERWYTRKLSNSGFKLPGTTASNFVGEKFETDLAFTKENLRHLRQHYRYVGVSWYQTEIYIPETYQNKVILLNLERVMFESRVFIDEVEIGACDSLSTPHVYNLTNALKIGKHQTLTIRIDNRDIQNIGTLPSSYTDETQTIWNGIIGNIELQVLNEIYCDQVRVYPDVKNRLVKVFLKMMNYTEKHKSVDILVHVTFKGDTDQTIFFNQMLRDEMNEIELIYPLNECHLWDEFNPNLYQLNIDVKGYDKRQITFGMREFKTNGRQFTINGNTTFLRGTLDCAIFPLTGHPSMERSYWEKVFNTVKEYGLNHVRYHSWCPPEIAFTVADELGLYLQVEGPMWMDNWSPVVVGKYESHYDYLPKEAMRILDTFGNHPSFVLYANGNELNGDWELMRKIIKSCKAHDDRHLYTLTSNWDRSVDEEDDFFVSQTVDGLPVRGQYQLNQMVEGTTLHFDAAIKLREIPVISHEVGQYSVYPDLSEIEQFSGVLRPVNYECIKKNLEDNNLIQYAKEFTLGSGQLALNLYKDEIEAALRTHDMAGFQLLDLHDFPGQSTATVGLLNSFWDSKGITDHHYFKQFCQEVVPLAIMDKRIYTTDDDLKFSISIANYSLKELIDVTIEWEVRDVFNLLTGGSFTKEMIPGGLFEIGEVIEKPFVLVDDAKELTLNIKIKDTNYQNAWTIWVYPHQNEEINDILIAESYNDAVIQALEVGKKVLLCPKEETVNLTLKGKFFPVFWSPIHFTSKDPCGLIINDQHKVFDHFPTKRYINYQWKDIVENSYSVAIDHLPLDFEPIVQVIPNFYNNQKLTNIFECQVLNGKLMVCTIDLLHQLVNNPVGRQLKSSLIKYIKSKEFNPRNTLTLSQLEMIFNHHIGSSTGLIDLALNKRAFASSSKSDAFKAENGNDGSLETCWMASNNEPGHYWMVDLGENYELSGTNIVFCESENYLYTIHTSLDGVDYHLVVNQTGQTKTDQIRFDEFNVKARYVKIVYNGVPGTKIAGHKEFKVFKKE